jgi:hypothetical protein
MNPRGAFFRDDAASAHRDGAGSAGLLEVAVGPGHFANSTELAGAPTVSGFQVIGKLGSGASGQIWLAEEVEGGRIVALKILHRHGTSAASHEVLQQELRILSTLVHPNLVLLYHSVVTADGRPGLAMEWVDGWPLDEWLDQRPHLSLAQKLELFRGIVKGVAFLHDHGVIHRDLKPANVIVDSAGGVKIVDFGLARLHRGDAAAGPDGGSVGVSGTLHFMAPEQAANGAGSRAMPVDVYALGLILYRLLTGDWLRSADQTPSETLALVLAPPPLEFKGAARAIPRDLQSILRQALAAHPTHRYHHARDLEADLERFAARLPVRARRHTFFYLASTLVRRQARRSVMAGVLVLVGLVTGGALYHRHRLVVDRNEANLRYAYTLTSFTLGTLRDQLRAVAPDQDSGSVVREATLPQPPNRDLPLPVDANGELDLRYYHAMLADLRSASSESHGRYSAALNAIQPALDLYCQLAREVPDDPERLYDAARARLAFARLLERVGRIDAAGDEGRKVLLQLDRLMAWQGFDDTRLSPLRCDALRLVAREAHHSGNAAEAFRFGQDALAACSAGSSGAELGADSEVMPRLALAAADLADYGIAAGSPWQEQARLDLDRALAMCREVRAREPKFPALSVGLIECMYASVRLSLHARTGDELGPLFTEAAEILFPLSQAGSTYANRRVRDLSILATEWARMVLEHPEFELPERALRIASDFTARGRRSGNRSDQFTIQRGRLFLYRSRLYCRFQDRAGAVRPASRAVSLLVPVHRRDPENLSLALLAAAALQQARSLADLPQSGWNAQQAHDLEMILDELEEKEGELTHEQRVELALAR